MRRRPTFAGSAVRSTAAIAALAAVAWAPGCSILDDEPERDAEGSIAEEGDLSAFSLEVGDCIVDLESLSLVVTEVPVVPCDQPHEGEIFETFDLPDGDIPDSASLTAQADEGCAAAFEPYFGEPYESSALSITHLTPTEQSWEQGDQEVACIAVGELAPAEGTDTTAAAEPG